MSKFTKEQLNEMDVDALLDADLSQIGEVEPIVPKPTGLYELDVLSCGIENVGADERRAIVLTTKVLSCIELDKPEEESEFTEETFPFEHKETFFLDAEGQFGTRSFRTIFADYAEAMQLTSVRQIVETLNQGAKGECIIKRRTYKHKDSGEMRTNNSLDLSGFVMH